MADIDKALVYQVTNDSKVAALIAGRFYPVSMPQSATFPLAVYQFVSGTVIQVHGEVGVLPLARVQITCWGLTFMDVVEVDRAIKNSIDGKRGNWGTGAYVTAIEECVAETTPRDDRDPNTAIYQRSRDFSIQWKE